MVFNNFIHGEDSTVTVYGDSAGPSDVTWLNEGIKSLQVNFATLYILAILVLRFK